MIANRIKELRLARGIPTQYALWAKTGVGIVAIGMLEEGSELPSADQLSKLTHELGATVEELYPDHVLEVLAHAERVDAPTTHPRQVARHFEWSRGPERLFVSPEELTWSERNPRPNHEVDAFLSLACSTQQTPHLLLDTIAVLTTLGVNFAAAAGAAGCCGAMLSGHGWTKTKFRKAQLMGARTNVNWCTGCENRLAGQIEEGLVLPIRNVQLLTFLDERLRELGDKVPWRTEVRRRVVTEGHTRIEFHKIAHAASERLLSRIPGVEFVGFFDGNDSDSPCVNLMGGPTSPEHEVIDGPPARPLPRTRQEVLAHREEVGEMFNALGADTVACQHQDCHLLWSYYASERIDVVHPVSLLAEALGVRHPDRFQEAARLGDPEALLERTRPIWTAWGLGEDRARAFAYEVADPRFVHARSGCGCGTASCGSELIALD